MLDLLLKHHKPLPRYTSYPTAPTWEKISDHDYKKALQTIEKPLSLYFHIPFCKTMCLFCGCSVILNRNQENETRYVSYLQKEMALVTKHLKKKSVAQLHFGGGTPTQLAKPLLGTLFKEIEEHFDFEIGAEIAIEIDPRTVGEDGGEKLRYLKNLGFNRVSFGVQDTNDEVQKAIKRFQSFDMTKKTFSLAKDLQFRGINIDLIYGLPLQTKERFAKTIQNVLSLMPDRIALFSYAKIPWLKPHQKAIPENTLPSLEEKFALYVMAREAFVKAGYIAIGMDHFALPHDELSLSYKNKTLQRNFQGYTVTKAEDSIGFGVTAIGFAQNMYTQNIKDLNSYYATLDQNHLPIDKGKILTIDDQLRKWVIHSLMCQFELDKDHFFQLFKIDFNTYFGEIPLEKLENEGLIKNSLHAVKVLPIGELFIRNIVTIFDAYITNKIGQFSQSI